MRLGIRQHIYKNNKVSKVLNNPKTTQADIDEYAQIMQAVMDERQENDGEPLCMIV